MLFALAVFIGIRKCRSRKENRENFDMQYCDETEGSNHGSDSEDDEEDDDIRSSRSEERRNGIRE